MRRTVWPVIGCLAAASSCATRSVKTPSPRATVIATARPAPASAVRRAMETHAKADRQVRNAIELGEGDGQARLLRDRLLTTPDDLDARARLAERYEELGLHDLAVEHLRIATERNPGDGTAQLRLAQSLDRAGRAKLAAETLDRYLAGYGPDASAEAHSWAGILRDKLGQNEAAERHHRAAVQLDPEKAYVYNNLGQNLLLQSRASDAAAAFASALKLEPRSEIARNNMATALLASDPGKAIHHLKSVSDPSTAHNNLAAIHIEQGRYDEARKELNLALGYRTDNIAALRNLALVSELDGRPAQWTLPGAAAATEKAAGASRWHRMGRALAKVFVSSETEQQQSPSMKPAKQAGKEKKPPARS